MKAKSAQTEANYQVLKSATAEARQAYTERAIKFYMADLVAHRAGLAAVGMEFEKYAPYSGSQVSREQYKLEQAKIASVNFYFELDKTKHPHGCYRHNEPHFVTERKDAEAKCIASARQAANLTFDTFLYKMVGKIGAGNLLSACYEGVIWDGCTLTANGDMGQQVWHTKCIMNRSIYNKLFNQWPTRRVS